MATQLHGRTATRASVLTLKRVWIRGLIDPSFESRVRVLIHIHNTEMNVVRGANDARYFHIIDRFREIDALIASNCGRPKPVR